MGGGKVRSPPAKRDDPEGVGAEIGAKRGSGEQGKRRGAKGEAETLTTGLRTTDHRIREWSDQRAKSKEPRKRRTRASRGWGRDNKQKVTKLFQDWGGRGPSFSWLSSVANSFRFQQKETKVRKFNSNPPLLSALLPIYERGSSAFAGARYNGRLLCRRLLISWRAVRSHF
ncbi:MAG: hypothetical protein QOH39_1979 [Verrucomicrobiota bacterium]|jgi:hypothetical protein